MKKATVSGRGYFSLLVLSMLGSVSLIGGTSEGGRDTWITILLAALLYLPLLFCTLSLLPGEHSVEGVFSRCAGKVGGRLFSLFYGLTAWYLAAVTAGVFVFFLSETTLWATPRPVLALMMGCTLFFMARAGCAALGRTGEMLLPIVMAFVLLSVLVTLPQCDFRALLPLQEKWNNLFQGTLTALILSFAECFFPLVVLGVCLTEEQKRKQGAMGAVFLTALTLCSVFIKNLAALDYYAVSSYYFPSFAVASLVSLGSFFQRFEIFVAVNFLFCQFCKAGLCILFAQKALAPVFSCREKLLTMPLTLSAVNLALLFFTSEMELFTFLGLEKYILTPALLLFPPLLALGRFWRSRRHAALQKKR